MECSRAGFLSYTVAAMDSHTVHQILPGPGKNFWPVLTDGQLINNMQTEENRLGIRFPFETAAYLYIYEYIPFPLYTVGPVCITNIKS